MGTLYNILSSKNVTMTIGAMVILGLIVFKFYSLTNELEITKSEVELLKRTVTIKESDVANRDTVIKQLNSQITLLATEIDDNNQHILDQSIKLQKAKLRLTEWKNKPDTVRYKVIYKHIKDIDYSKFDCNESIELNRNISTLKYEDL